MQCREHAARYEAEFFTDMAALDVRLPTMLSRVSDYIPEIVEYIEQIISNGMAYSVNGSVYFDTQAFKCVLSGMVTHPAACIAAYCVLYKLLQQRHSAFSPCCWTYLPACMQAGPRSSIGLRSCISVQQADGPMSGPQVHVGSRAVSSLTCSATVS